MRSLLVDIYPPSLHAAGLAAALRDLVAGAARPTSELDVDDRRRLPRLDAARGAEAVFRVAQEALRNAVRARRRGAPSDLTLRRDGGRRCVLEVGDDGAGFGRDDRPARTEAALRAVR